jgi:predicted phage tail protein
VLKPDSLIVVEESHEDPVTKATKVAVQVTTGAVDLSTGKFPAQGSVSQVSFQNATASLGEDSRAVVRNDPAKDVHEITVDSGQAQVTRGSQSLRLGQYEQVTFSATQTGLNKQTVIAPPVLETPPNMDLRQVKDPKSTPVDFEWKGVNGAVAYHLMVSPSGMFSNLVVDKKIPTKTSAQVTGLDEGNYYWVVTAIDAKGLESQPSSPNKFNLVQQVESGNKAFLEIKELTLHGRVVEVVGRTETGSTVIINNEQVFSIAPDGTFRHFTSPLARNGENQITITAQNRKGDTKTIHRTIVIE